MNAALTVDLCESRGRLNYKTSSYIISHLEKQFKSPSGEQGQPQEHKHLSVLIWGLKHSPGKGSEILSILKCSMEGGIL